MDVDLQPSRSAVDVFYLVLARKSVDVVFQSYGKEQLVSIGRFGLSQIHVHDFGCRTLCVQQVVAGNVRRKPLVAESEIHAGSRSMWRRRLDEVWQRSRKWIILRQPVCLVPNR